MVMVFLHRVAMLASQPAPIPLRCPHCGITTAHVMHSDGLHLSAQCGGCGRSHPVLGDELPLVVRAMAAVNRPLMPGAMPPHLPSPLVRR